MATSIYDEPMFASAEVDEDTTLRSVEFRPTLVIGLGGSGHEVVVRLKARFLETFGAEIFKIVKLVAFDTDNKAIPVTNERGDQVTLVKDTELVNIGNVPVSSLIHNLSQNPTIESWLPADKIHVNSLHAGARQVRPLGRLAFFYHYSQDAKIKDRLLGLIRSLGNIKLRGALGEAGTIAKSRGINVFIVSSVCGGTGSGTFLDMTYLVRELIQTSGIRQEFCFINGILVMPQAFANVASDDILANAYAALRELQYFSKEGRFHAVYPDGTRTSTFARPFNICYLVDAVNENGKLLSGMEELAPMIAESIFIQIGSQVGKASDSVFDNVKSLDRMAPDPNGHEVPTCFSSLGTAGLVFPARPIISACTYRFGTQFITEGLFKAANEQLADDMARSFIEAQKLPPKPLLVALSADAKGTPILVRLNATPLAGVPHRELLGQLDQMLSQFETQKLNRDYKQAVDSNAQTMLKSVSQALKQETRRLVDSPEQYGPYHARAFLERLSTRFTGLIKAFGEDRTRIAEQQRRVKDKQPALKQTLNDALNSAPIPFVRDRKVAEARDEYVRSKEADFSMDFDIQLRNASMRLLTELKTVVDQLTKEVSALISKLSQVQERFQLNANALRQDRRLPFLTEDITSPKDVNKYYDSRKRDIASELARFTSTFGSLYAWTDRQREEIAQDIFRFVREAFTPIANEKIEEIIKNKSISPEQYLQDLRDNSIPFWNYQSARLGSMVDLESIAVIGVENMSSTTFADKVRRGETLTTTLDPHEVTVLHTKHGLPLFALTQIDGWVDKYENHIKRGLSPVHLMPDLPWLQDTEQGRQWFALGETFGYISKRGIWYYCKRKDPRLDEVQLGQGLDPAIRAFMANSKLVQEIQEMVQNQIKQIGNDQVAIMVFDYERRPRSAGAQAKTEQELQLAAGKFREEMGYSENDVIAVKAKMGKASPTTP